MTKLAPGVGPLSRPQVDALIAQSCALDNAAGVVNRPRMYADYLRWALSTCGRDGEFASAVHILRLLMSVRRQLGFWLGDETQDADPVREALDALVQLGEAAHCGFGFYLPVPVRQVEMPGGGTLVIGSLPTRALQRRLGPGYTVRTAGLARVVDAGNGNPPLASFPAQPFRQWLGVDGPGLQGWTDGRLRDARARLKPAAGDIGAFEAYLPDLAPRDAQYFRWKSSEQWAKWATLRGGTPRRLYLCRLKNKQADRYWLGRLQAEGEAALCTDEYSVEPAQVRRLQYGLDQLANLPVSARIEVKRGEENEVVLNSWLPPEEWRLFTALASSVPREKLWPLRYRVRRADAPVIVHALRALAIRVETV
jgi:hypothetical protein